MLKPASVAELLVQAKLIWLVDAVVALRLLGAARVVVALATLEKLESPAAVLNAWTS